MENGTRDPSQKGCPINTPVSDIPFPRVGGDRSCCIGIRVLVGREEMAKTAYIDKFGLCSSERRTSSGINEFHLGLVNVIK